MAQATRYGRLLAAPRSEPMVLAVPAISWPAQGVLTEHQGKAVLSQLGVPVPAGDLARTKVEAEAIAARIGYPVALKAQSPALPHKTEAGGVAVGIADRTALAVAWERIHRNVAAARPDVSLDGVLVEAMAAPGLELVVGGRRDPHWGPVVMAGAGGIWVETLGDVRLMPAALSPAAIAAELSKLKIAPLLQGLRGKPAIDIEALCATIARVGALLRDIPDIAEIDINPLVAYPSGVLALDVLLVRA
jgi:acyl-CoA synthetase (NDP forming)